MEKMQKQTVQLTDGTVCKAISANLLCQAGIYASTLYGTQGGNNARTHTCPYDSADTWNAPRTLLWLRVRVCVCVCVCVCAGLEMRMISTLLYQTVTAHMNNALIDLNTLMNF